MHRRSLVLCAFLAACATAPDAGAPGPVSVSPRSIWGDAELTLRSVDLTAPVVVRIQGDTAALEQRRVDDTTIAVRLPPGMRGSVQLTVDDGSRLTLAEPVTVYGFIRQFDFDADPESLLDLDIFPGKVLGGDPEGAFTLDPAAGALRRYRGTGYFHYGFLEGPGPTYQDGVFVSRQPDGSGLELWRLFPLPERVGDGIPRRTRHAMQLNPNAWIIGTDDDYELLVRPDETAAFAQTIFEHAVMSGFIMSPRHDRGVIVMASAHEDPPVLDAPSGTVAWRMPVRAVFGADFTADGELLAVAGGASWDATTSRLLVLRASDGSIVGETALDRPARAVHFDPVLPLIYLLFGTSDSLGTWPQLVVLHRDSFRPVAVIDVPHSVLPASCVNYFSCLSTLITRGPEQIVSVVSGARAYTFDLPPGADTFAVAGGIR